MLGLNSESIPIDCTVYFLNEYTGTCNINEMMIRHKKLENYFNKLPRYIKISYNLKIYCNLNFTIKPLFELCLLKCNQINFRFLITLNFNKKYFKYCSICNNIILNISGDYTHDKNGNLILKTPQNLMLPICELLKYKNYNGLIKKNKFNIPITYIGIIAYYNQEKINNILYKPILDLKN